MIVVTHFISFLVNEYFTPACLREVRDITREVVQCLKKQRKAISGPMGFTKYNRPFIFQNLYVAIIINTVVSRRYARIACH